MATGWALIKACCDKCGPFQVSRRRGYKTTTCGVVYDLPANVVCPKCRMWAKVDQVEPAKQ